MRLIFCLGFALFLSACAIKPVHHAGTTCNFPRWVIDVDMPQEFAGQNSTALAMVPQSQRSPSEHSLLNALRSAELKRASGMSRTRSAAPEPESAPAMLFLSGGSQHGAFGAGFLKGWKERENNLPRFTVVTGISTGAILATFAFVNEPDAIAKAYSLHHESQVLKPLIAVKGGSPTFSGQIELLKKGAMANLAPLRNYLSEVLTDHILSEVAAAARQERILRVGVVNVDTGEAVSFDLGSMAVRWAEAAAHPADNVEAQQRKALAKACYVEAIIASSSAPLAALPVFIDERMYIDGGARFGAYSNELENLAALARLPQNLVAGKPIKPSIYLLINGDQRLGSRCGRESEADCDPPRSDSNAGKPLGDPSEDKPVGPHGDWNFLKLALRSEQILTNQVYRFSADSIVYLAHRNDMELHYAQILMDKGTHRFRLDDPELGTGEMSCDDAYDLDKKLLDPVQFYPRYMHCLVDYGYQRGKAGW